jgi:hypothetical protein
MTLKVIGHQWYWSYEYSDSSNPKNILNFDSYMKSEEDLTLGNFRLLEVDNRIVLPIKKNKKNESSRNGLKAIGPLTFKFKNKSFYFKHIKIPSFISLRNCKHISEFLGKFDIEAFSSFTKSQFSKNKAEILLNFIESLKEDEILNEFISFFSTKEILNFEQCYILEFCSPLLMRVLSQGLLIELRNHNEIRNDFFIKNIEKNLYFTEEEKKEFIFFLQKNINKIEAIIEFWVL